MKRAVFEIKQNPVGRYYFIFKDIQGTGIVVSRSFRDRSQLEKCLSIVRSTSRVAGIYQRDMMPLPFFRIENKKEGYVFSLMGFEGEIIFSSEDYLDRNECVNAIKLLKYLSLDAGIVDSV